MSELDEAPAGTSGAAAAPVSAGSLLRQAREAAGLHIAALAVSLKVPVRKLEALESDRLDLLPDAVFARALASSVCRALKIDPAPVLGLLPNSLAPLVSQRDAGLNAPFRAPGDVAPPGLLTQLSRPAVLGVLILLVGALVILLLPSAHLPSMTLLEPARPAADLSATPPPPIDPAVTSPTGVTVFPAEGPVAAASSPVAAALVPAIAAPAPAPLPATAAKPAAAVPPTQGALAGLVTFAATGTSWVQVVDAKGVVTLQRTLQAGENADAGGALPLTVTVGRADMTRVQVRGKAMDLATLARDNVARFEVK